MNAVRAAVQSPRTPSLRLIECEFPAVTQLNKLGDGSLRSSQAVNDANVETALALVRALTVPAFLPGPLVWLVTSTAGAAASAKSVRRAGNQHSLRNGLPPVKSRDVCVLMAPCNRQDYEAAKRLADNGNAVVLVNGFAKVGIYRQCMDTVIQFQYYNLFSFDNLLLIIKIQRIAPAFQGMPLWHTISNRSRTTRKLPDT